MTDFNVKKTRYRDPARSKRLDRLGYFGGTPSTSIIGSGGGGTNPNDHKHGNLHVLESFSTDANNYLYITQQKDGSKAKVKAGFADEFPDIVETRKTFKAGAEVSDLEVDKLIQLGKWAQGWLGSGAKMWINEKGQSQLEIDKIMVRMEMLINVLNIHEIKATGGEILVSVADMICLRVEDITGAYRCYFDTAEGTILNKWEIGDQARCQRFDGKNQGYYWRLVVAKGTDYIDLSKADSDGVTIPLEKDNVIQLGNRTNPDRQHAIMISSNGTSPSLKMYSGINSFSMTDKEVVVIGKESSFKGKVYITAGSGWKNLEGLEDEFNNARKYAEDLVDGIKIGGVNLLRNSGFTGNYKAVDLTASSKLSANTDLFSDQLFGWISSGATVIDDKGSRSGFACTLGMIAQDINKLVIKKEQYVISFKAKGKSLDVSFGGNKETIILTPDYAIYSVKMTNTDSAAFVINGIGTVCEIMLERGTVRTDWNKNSDDGNEADSRFIAIKYITEAIANGSTEIIGGLILSSMLMLGKYKDGKMSEVTCGLNGLSNDGDDPAFWAGGTFQDAIRAIMNPYDKTAAQVVITHAGLAILNNVHVRGHVDADSGRFFGSIATPFIFSSDNENLELSENFNYQVTSNPMHPTTIILPNDLIFNGVHCNIYLPFISKNTGPLYIKQSNNSGFLGTGGIRNDDLKILDVIGNTMVTLVAMPDNHNNDSVVWYLQNGDIHRPVVEYPDEMLASKGSICTRLIDGVKHLIIKD